MSTFLQFSGGKDSLACLYLLRDRLHEITVAWVNAGAAFPETLEYMSRIREMVPHFIEIKSTQNIAEFGYPADLLPTAATLSGRIAHPAGKYKFQSKWDCCFHAISIPMHNAMIERGATTLIRGTKKADFFHSPIEPGIIFNGIRYEFPVWDWTDGQVLEFLASKDIEVPPHYQQMSTGLDCMNCTAYLAENSGKLSYMRKHHPKQFQEVTSVLQELAGEIAAESGHIVNILEEATWA